MTGQPKNRQKCPVCGRKMKWFGDHWLCTEIKFHDAAVRAAKKSRSGAGRPKKVR